MAICGETHSTLGFCATTDHLIYATEIVDMSTTGITK